MYCDDDVFTSLPAASYSYDVVCFLPFVTLLTRSFALYVYVFASPVTVVSDSSFPSASYVYSSRLPAGPVI